MTAFLLLPPFAILVFVALGYRRRFLRAIEQRDAANSIACRALDDARVAIEESNYWQAACRKSYGSSFSLTDAQVARLYRGIKDGFPDELRFVQKSQKPVCTFKPDELPPSDLPIGTPSNPVLTPNGDFAVYCSLADLMTGGKT